MYKRNNQGWLKHIDFILWDAVALQISFLFAYIARHGYELPYTTPAYRNLAVLLVLVDILVAAVFNTMHNVMKRGLYNEAVQTLKQVSIVLVVMTLYMFSVQTGDVYSRLTIYLSAVFHLILGFGIRLLWKRAVPKLSKGKAKATMILVADEKKIQEIIGRSTETDEFEYSGIVLTNRDGVDEEIEGIKIVANLDNAAEYICRERVDEVFVYPQHLSDIEIHRSPLVSSVEGFIGDTYSVFSKTEYQAVSDINTVTGSDVATLIEQCHQMAVPVHINLPISNIGMKSFVEKVGGYNVLTTTSNYASPLQMAMKRLLDVLGGLVGSIAALIIIAILGPKIKKASPGPILFKQTRIGLNGKKFQIYKIRSMYMDAEERKKELQKDNRVGDAMMFKLDWDPRIIGNEIINGEKRTGIGEKIRSGSWDEWPQFFNVLKGDMSLVGTRPPTPDEWEKYKYHHRARLAMKPGITGMWQVSGRSRITDFEEVVRLDTEYINNWNIGLDLRILLRTVKAVSKKDGAL